MGVWPSHKANRTSISNKEMVQFDSLALSPVSSFLLLWILGGSSEGPSRWAHSTHGENLDWEPSSQLWSYSCRKYFRGVNQQLEYLSCLYRWHIIGCKNIHGVQWTALVEIHILVSWKAKTKTCKGLQNELSCTKYLWEDEHWYGCNPFLKSIASNVVEFKHHTLFCKSLTSFF